MQSDQKKECINILSKMEKRFPTEYSYFTVNVRDVLSHDEWLEYKRQIKECRDLQTIKSNVESGHYPSISSFDKDVKLCFANAKDFNTIRYPYIAEAASKLQKVSFRFHAIRNIMFF